MKKKVRDSLIVLPVTETGGESRRRKSSSREPPQMSFPPSLAHVFTRNPIILSISILTSLLLLIRPGNGLHPPQCQWSLYQDIERLNCLVEPGNNLIVEEEVHGIGPEHAKSLWVQCSDMQGQQQAHKHVIHVHPSEESEGFMGTDKPQVNGDTGGFVLSHGVFMAVPNLRDLRLENCRIAGITPGALSYLPYLQNLTVRAHTSLTPWPSSLSGGGASGAAAATSSSSPSTLEIKPGVLRGLPELRHLDLSTTSLSTLPNDFLCFLPSLNYLNLTGCWLRDFRSIGIAPSDPTNPHNCGNQIRVLDLSANHFTLLPPATFATVSKLEELRIELNSITIAAERALLGLNQLKVISLAGNQLTSLPPEFFKDNRQLKEIHLQNNSLAVLAPGLFSGLEHLVILDLSNNELTSEWVNGETFSGLVRLVILNLANNDLTRVDSVLFRDLYSLQVLNLENNQLSFVAEDAFSGMNNMHTLLLSHNHLKAIDTFICNGLFVLSFLVMDNNKIETVGPDSFKNCSNLNDLNLSGNKLTQVPVAIGGLNLLRTLDLGENKITNITNASYQSLPNLYGLRLTDNSILTVPKDAFNNLASLKIVNLAKNNITRIEPGAFDNNPNLQAVRLDSNQLTDITDLFRNIPNLLWLNISANQLEDLRYQEFPPRLQWLDLRSNKIHTVGNCLEIDNLRIRNLDMSHNYITEIGSSNLPDSIENLILSNNRIHHIQPYTFFRKPNLTRVDVSYNQLVRLDQNSLRLSPGRINSNGNDYTAEIFLGHNPLQCDCTMEWLQNMNSGDEASGQYPMIQDVGDVKCTLSFDRMYEPISYMSIQSSQFLCKYESHCFSLCQCCDFDACDCEMSCPKNCSCYHDQAWSSNLVDCSMMEQTFIPGRIPMDVTELYLDGNVFPSLDSHSFIGRKNLKALYLNASHIEVIQNRTFHGLKALRVLHLENNFIERLDGFEFDDLDGLEELHLHQNSISFISNETFAPLLRLRVLSLYGNNLVDLAIWQVTTRVGRLSTTLRDISLRGNEWSCECHFATQLKEWLIENRAKISDASQVHCVDQVSSSSLSSSSRASSSSSTTSSSANGGGGGQFSKSQTELVVVRLLDQRNHRCSQSTDLSIREPTNSSGDEYSFSDYIPLILCITGVILLLILISILEGSCREPHAERDKLFDAFVSYSSKDEAWVRQVLAAELERNDPPYRLCLRYRDLPTGGTYLADTIVQAAEASRRTVLVLSHHFLKGELHFSQLLLNCYIIQNAILISDL
jgi:Leucine-rich repeat (LRR) protein